MLLCILYTVCYLTNHEYTMLLTFVCSIFNFFLYLTMSFCFHLFSFYVLLKFPSLSNSTTFHKTDCLRKLGTVFAACLLSWGQLLQLSLSSGSSLVWWFSMSAVQMSLWNFFHHPFISVLCYVFCFLDSISSFFFVYFLVPVEVNCFGNYTSFKWREPHDRLWPTLIQRVRCFHEGAVRKPGRSLILALAWASG